MHQDLCGIDLFKRIGVRIELGAAEVDRNDLLTSLFRK